MRATFCQRSYISAPLVTTFKQSSSKNTDYN